MKFQSLRSYCVATWISFGTSDRPITLDGHGAILDGADHLRIAGGDATSQWGKLASEANHGATTESTLRYLKDRTSAAAFWHIA